MLIFVICCFILKMGKQLAPHESHYNKTFGLLETLFNGLKHLFGNVRMIVIIRILFGCFYFC